jgi:hypothetical protein
MLDAAVVGGDMEISDKNEAVAPDGEEQARQERQQPLARPASRATAVAVAILDITGILVTLAAVAVHRLNGEANRWWWAVGIASLLAVFTTVLLIRIWIQRRLFIKASLRLAEREGRDRGLALMAPWEGWCAAPYGVRYGVDKASRSGRSPSEPRVPIQKPACAKYKADAA